MIRRLIILLLIVGCEEEPEGACVFLVGVDSISFQISMEEPFHFKCEDNYIEEDCCMKGIHPNSSNEIKTCKGSFIDSNIQIGVMDSLNLYPTYWINNESCSQYCQEADCD